MLFSSLLALSMILTQSSAASAVRPDKPGDGGGPSQEASLLGNDISWPQCGGRLPSGQAFGIVGVNGGLANTNNPCFAEQLAWAKQSNGLTSQPKAALYVNTANPLKSEATVWPEDNTVYGEEVVNPYGTCNNTDGAACSYIYGYTRAYEDAQQRINNENPSLYKWWLDVETGNSWSDTDLAANAASLEGMADYFKSIDVAGLGVYSTNYQWTTIVGSNIDTDSPLNSLESWLAGARTERGAKANCSEPPLTAGGVVTVSQFVSKGLDYNVSCR